MDYVTHFCSKIYTFIYVTVIVQKVQRSIYYTMSGLTLPLTYLLLYNTATNVQMAIPVTKNTDKAIVDPAMLTKLQKLYLLIV